MDLLDALAERLHRAAATEMAGEALTVGDIYQRLIPYRTVRGEIGVLEFAAYEHALLRLFAGEGDHAEVREDAARQEIQRELASVNPILGIYRDYEGARVVLNGAAAPAVAARRGGGEHVVAATAGADGGDPAARDERLHHPVRGPANMEGPASPPDPGRATPNIRLMQPSDGSVSRACGTCDQPLPHEAGLRFCPFCGDPQEPVPCSRCGSTVKADWSFCIRCGASVLV